MERKIVKPFKIFEIFLFKFDDWLQIFCLLKLGWYYRGLKWTFKSVNEYMPVYLRILIVAISLISLIKSNYLFDLWTQQELKNQNTF